MDSAVADESGSERRNHRVVVSRHGPPEVLELIEEAVPQPGPGEVRVAVHAAGVSAYDLMFRRSGMLPGTPKVPFTPGEDVVGVVDGLGEGVAGLELGQRVAATTIRLGVGGGYAELVCLPASAVVPVPAGVDAAKAVCVTVNYLTAYAVMHRTAQVRAAERILVHGAAGGVGSALVQLGVLAGLEVFGTASAPTHDFVRSLGATPIDYRREDFVTRVRELTEGEGVDVVFDPIGGAHQLARSFRALRRGGRLVWFGVAAAKQRGLRVIPSTLLMRGLLALVPGRRLLTTDLGDDEQWLRTTLARLLELVAEGTLDPPIAARIPLAEAARAHALLERGGHTGKIVLITPAGEAAE